MISYASVANLEDYLEDGLPGGYTNDEFERILELASVDVDLYCNAVFQDMTAPLKFATSVGPIVWDAAASTFTRLQEAIIAGTCAQAEYRLAKGDQFFVEVQRREGEFSGNQVKQPRFGPKAREALRRSGYKLRTITASMI